MWTILKKLLTHRLEGEYKGNFDQMKKDEKAPDLLEAILKDMGSKPFCKTFCQVAMDTNVQMNNIMTCYEDIVTNMSERATLKSEILTQTFHENENQFKDVIERHFLKFVSPHGFEKFSIV